MRNTLGPDSEEPTVPGFEKMPSVPVSKRSPEDREKDVDSIVNWLRQGKPNDLDTPNDEFAKIDQMLPKKKGQTPKDRAKEIESCLDWCRSHGVKPTEDADIPGFKKIGSIPVSKRSPEDRKKDTDAILNWMRAGKPDDVPMADEFKKIDSASP